eukprot:Skav215001  [mRNA]  locus=scaffold508:1001281:1007076:- [translate_table: standard]
MLGDDEPVPTTPMKSDLAGASGELAAMRTKIAQLEALLQQQQQPAAPVTASGHRPLPTSLLDAPGAHDGQLLEPLDLQLLKEMVGPPPKRLGKGEQAVVKVPQGTSTFLAELDREVQEAGGMDDMRPVPWDVQPAHRSSPQDACPADEADPRSDASVGSKVQPGPAGKHLSFQRWRRKWILKRLHRREGLRCSGGIPESSRERQSSGCNHQSECPLRIGDFGIQGRSIVAEDVLGNPYPDWRPEDHGSSWLHASLWLGDCSQCPERSDDGILRSNDELRGAGQFGWRKNPTGLDAYRTGGTQPSDAGHQSSTSRDLPVCQVAITDLGGGKHRILEGHRSLRDETAGDRSSCQTQSSEHSFGSKRAVSKAKGKTQKAKGWEGWPHGPGRSPHRIGRQRPGVRAQSSRGASNDGFTVPHDFQNPLFHHKLFNCMNSSSDQFDSFDIMLDALARLERTPGSFSVFRSKSLVPAWSLRTVRTSVARKSLWPIPPPLWCWTGKTSLNRRQRSRRRQHHVRHLLLQRIVCMLNWISLGYPSQPCHDAQAGEPLTDDQYKVLGVLEQQILHFCSAQSLAAADLGRFSEKFSALRSSAADLPDHPEVGLAEVLHELKQGFDNYTSYERPHFAASDEHHESHAQCSHHPEKVVVPNTTNKPVVASRIKWRYPPSFDPRPYLLDPVVAAVFDNPDTLRTPSYTWPTRSKARVHCSRPNLLELMKIWDAHGSLALFPCDDVDEHETVGLFAVPKDEDWDRLIINPTVLNSRMYPYSRYTKSLAPGALLSLLSLDDEHSFRYCADDLSDFYYTFKVPRARARRNCIGTKVYRSEVQGLSCFDPSHSGPFFPALATLAMGDSHAVEVAQGSHYALLQLEAGCMQPSETLEYRKPIPRSNFVELLAIDDHVGVQKVKTSELKHQLPARDTIVFEQANRAYAKVGLVSHAGKQRRFETQGTILGADFDGVRGRVSAPRARVQLLIWVTSIICRKGTCTRQILLSLLGCWIHVILFRRPLLSLIDALFKEGFDKPPNIVFCLSKHARHELMSLCLLGPCAQADLRVEFAPKIFALDASPWGGGIVVADSNPQAVAELWRHSEQKGYHTNLLSPAAEILRSHGVDPEEGSNLGVLFPNHNHPVEPTATLRLPRSLQEGILYDCVELFRGSGNWSTCHQSHGLIVHEGVELTSKGLFFRDLSDNGTFRDVISLALRRVVREWHAGPPCLTFGTLRRPRLRSKEQPSGFNPSDPLTAAHNLLARRTAMLGCIVVLSGAYFSCEQSGSSVMFRMHLFRVLVMLGCVVTRVASCSFGSAFNKPYQWLHNKGWLTKLDGVCNCRYKGNHFKVEGTFTHQSIADFNARCMPSASAVYGRMPKPGEPVSSFSAQYPISMMHRMAQGSAAAKAEGSPCFSVQDRLLSYARVGLSGLPDDSLGPSLDDECKPREWFEDPEWISELADSLPFRALFKYKFRRLAHINILESQVYSSWIKHCAKSHPNSRLVGLLDSRVTLGSAAKGRSSSFSISRVLKQTIPYQIGSNLYPGGLHVYSAKNRADAPSRDREIEPPTKALPQWYLDLLQGDFRRFDLVCQSAQVPKLSARWLRFLLLLGGDIEPNPGPPTKPRDARGELDMAAGFSRATAIRMKKCLEAFAKWVSEEAGLDFQQTMQQAESCGLALRAYGLHLYRSGLPRYMLVYAITAVQDTYPQHRSLLGAAWQVDKKWQQVEPGHCRPVLSLPVLQAIICLGLLWNWPRWVGISMIGFCGMLHPSEFIGLCRRDLMLPSDTGLAENALYVHLRFPKTARFARQQHVKICDPDVIRFVIDFFGPMPLDSKLFGASIYAYRSQWNAIMTRLGIPCTQVERGITPGSLRGAGATLMYLQTENIPLICWRGRWARLRTLEFYLQEVAAQVLMHSLSDDSQKLIHHLSSLCKKVFVQYLHGVKLYACGAGT